MLIYTAVALITGYICDLIFGDPRWLYHPVRLIGNAIAFLEKNLRRIFPAGRRGERAAGFVLVVIICVGCIIVPAAVLSLCFSIHRWLGLFVMCFMCFQFLATKSLKVESMRVYDALKEGGIEEGRKAVAMIVGRDTESLDEKGIIKATVETVAENFSDGVLAPMLYMAIGGPVLMCLYKGINTMDSMIAYKSEKYINIGRYAAKLDDAANFIPARIAGILLIISAAFTGGSFRDSLRVFRRDRMNHASPNSAQTESAVAGALGIQLAGPAYYFGEYYNKKTIGDNKRPVEAEDIKRTNRMMYGAGLAGVLLCLAVNGAITIICCYLL